MVRSALKHTIEMVPRGRIARFSKAKKITIALHVVSASQIRQANRLFRKKDRSTDVLSFPQMVHGIAAFESHLGDVLICLSIAIQQAKHRRLGVAVVLADLTIHGLLHLFDYDHERGKWDEKIMFGLQNRILSKATGSTP